MGDLAVHVHVDRHDVSKIKMSVTEDVPRAIDGISAEQPDMRENYDLVKKALSQHKDEIVDVVPA